MKNKKECISIRIKLNCYKQNEYHNKTININWLFGYICKTGKTD